MPSFNFFRGLFFGSAILADLFFGTPTSAQSSSATLVLPSRYVEGLFYVQPITTKGDTFNFYTDTGGGLFIYRAAAERFELPIINIGGEGDEAFFLTSLPAFKPEAMIPLPESREGRLPVFAPAANEREAMMDFDGMLGQEWFAGRVWTFDYPQRRLLLHASNEVLKKADDRHRVVLGFKTDESGARLLNFPRIQAMIDGENLDLLFDTGATTTLSDSALSVLKDNRPAERATSFIATTTFEKWRKRHPDWRVMARAEKETGEAMIEVSKITLAGYSVGPVWFTRRRDKNFHEFMSQFMDKRVEGALGGSALRYFRVTVDYPNAVALFEK
ncbi:hypothetical protein L0337_04035 [candidate division KSB1 bacterium]|nr:hypothetical protein [candidate division KSB1 bacterium]